jgi:hypothetical protein
LSIPDPKTATKERGGKKCVVLPFFVTQKNHKIETYINFELVKQKNLAHFTRIVELSTQKIVMKLSIWLWDPRSGIRKKLIPDPDPWVKKAPDLGSGSATLVRILGPGS